MSAPDEKRQQWLTEMDALLAVRGYMPEGRMKYAEALLPYYEEDPTMTPEDALDEDESYG